MGTRPLVWFIGERDVDDPHEGLALNRAVRKLVHLFQLLIAAGWPHGNYQSAPDFQLVDERLRQNRSRRPHVYGIVGSQIGVTLTPVAQQESQLSRLQQFRLVFLDVVHGHLYQFRNMVDPYSNAETRITLVREI
jgi:hypothetical protein